MATFFGEQGAEIAEFNRALRRGEGFVYNASPSALYSNVSPDDLFVDYHQYTQNPHFIQTMVEKALARGLTEDQIEVLFKATAMGGFEYAGSDEILKATLSGTTISRSTEYVLRFRVQDRETLISLSKSILDAAEKRGVRGRARRFTGEPWLFADVRIVGLPSSMPTIRDPDLGRQWGQSATIFRQRFLCYKKINGGEMVKLFKKRPGEGWDNCYPVLINQRLANLVKK